MSGYNPWADPKEDEEDKQEIEAKRRSDIAVSRDQNDRAVTNIYYGSDFPPEGRPRTFNERRRERGSNRYRHDSVDEQLYQSTGMDLGQIRTEMNRLRGGAELAEALFLENMSIRRNNGENVQTSPPARVHAGNNSYYVTEEELKRMRLAKARR